MNTNNYNEWIADYVQDELSAEERAVLEREALDDAGLAEEMRLAIVLQAQRNVDQKKHWQSLLKQRQIVDYEGRTSGRSRIFNIRLQWVAAIAVLVFVVFMLRFYTNVFLSNHELAIQALDLKYPSPVLTMDAPNHFSAKWVAGTLAYQKGHYSEAGPLFAAVEDQADTGINLPFYLGLCYLYQETADPKAALLQFAQCRHHFPQQLKEELDWFEALAYVMTGEGAAALGLLQKIVVNEGWNKEKARVLLEQLD